MRKLPRPLLRQVIGTWTSTIPRLSAETGANRFCFLNQERAVTNWNDETIPKLWLYNLHYFERPELKRVERWVSENPMGVGNGWEPYPLAIRIVNWIKWSLSGNPFSGAVVSSLQLQTDYLSQSVEHHLGANHLFADAVALTIAGMFFDGQHGSSLFIAGSKLLHAQLEEQILPDGAHYERSPMYHAIVLESLLDLINAARAYQISSDVEISFWSDKAKAMLSWMDNMEHPDGQIAFFNDATFDIAPDPAAIRSYASRLGIQSANIPLGSSGYVRLQQADTVLLFDAAPIGPDHQPGHAHADTLSFELSHKRQRILVNSGISTYERGADRLRQRGTAAHNTAEIDGVDQSEIWSAFRVGRRARSFDLKTDGTTFVEAAHDGYRRLKSPVIHRRNVRLMADRLIVTDSIEGSGTHQVNLFFHFHPEVKSQILLDSKLTLELRPSFWYSGFNTSVSNETAVGAWTGPCPVKFKTILPLS